jgi:hypothetical protein
VKKAGRRDEPPLRSIRLLFVPLFMRDSIANRRSRDDSLCSCSANGPARASLEYSLAARFTRQGVFRRSDTKQISRGKLSCLPCTIAESTLRTLMDMDFAASSPLVRHWRLISGFCSSTRTFDPCFLPTPPRGADPLHPSSMRYRYMLRSEPRNASTDQAGPDFRH